MTHESLRQNLLSEHGADVAAGLLTGKDAEALVTATLTADVAGMRQDWISRLILNCPQQKAARAGYLGALYQLRAEETPAAWVRSAPIGAFQRGVRTAISILESA